jgi:hypothetical protein
VERWIDKRKGQRSPEKRPGVTINRRDVVSVPVPNANLLWRDLHVRDVRTLDGKPQTKNIMFDIIVEGVTGGEVWTCGLEFDFANMESFYCRPLRLSEDPGAGRMQVPEQAAGVRIAMLPPMSGLTSIEDRLTSGSINTRIGEGRTAEVLRNLCYQVYTEFPEKWEKATNHIEDLFKAGIENPRFIDLRGNIELSYLEREVLLDISSAGRGLHQTLLLLTYMYANPGVVLLLDEPDAHLEILRQRQIYQLLVDTAEENRNQLIIASHAEVLLEEAARRDLVVAFVGKPHRINDRGSQVMKSLREIGFEDYYLAEETGWVLYLEGSTDLAILRAWADIAGHTVAGAALERPFVKYVGNQPRIAGDHFHGLREAYPQLLGLGVFDRIEEGIPTDLCAKGLRCEMWKKREIENYICYTEVLVAYAENSARIDIGPIFEGKYRVEMKSSIEEMEKALDIQGKPSPWGGDLKVSDEFLIPLFKNYSRKLKIPNVMEKKNFYELARFLPKEMMDCEIIGKLDMISEIHKTAQSHVSYDK